MYMHYNLLDNGVDSLRATADSLNALGAQVDLTKAGYHHLKDAILSINHAGEILFKFLLKEKSEHLIYRNLDSYVEARKLMIAQEKDNIMDIKGTKLDTVNLFEAVERLELVCGVEVPRGLQTILRTLNGHRNKLMHYEIDLDKETVGQLGYIISKAYEMFIEFFNSHISGFEILLEAARVDFTIDDYWDDYADYMGNVEEGKSDWEADMADLAEQRRGGFNRD